MTRSRLRVVLVGVNVPRYPSLALAYVHAYAAADPRLGGVGLTTLELDTTVDPWWIAYRVLALEPDVVAFSVMCWNARAVYEAVRLVTAARPETVVVLGGPEVGPIAETVLAEQSAIDVVVRGEGEETFAELLAAMLAKRDVGRVPGVTARRGDRVVSAPDRPLVDDLDSLPSPYLAGVLAPVEGATYLETYRGCPHRCAYCFEGKGYGRIRRFSDERVRAEIETVLSHRACGPSPSSTRCSISPANGSSGSPASSAPSRVARTCGSTRSRSTSSASTRSRRRSSLRAGVASVETGPQTIGAAALAACSRSFDAEAFRAGVDALSWPRHLGRVRPHHRAARRHRPRRDGRDATSRSG